MGKLLLFCYSAHDRGGKNAIVQHLAPFVRDGTVSHWSIDDLYDGENKFEGFIRKVKQANVALLILSSDFFADEEVQGYLEQIHRNNPGLRLIPVIWRPSLWQSVARLKDLRPVPADGRPSLKRMVKSRRDEVLAELVKRLVTAPPSPLGSSLLNASPHRSPRNRAPQELIKSAFVKMSDDSPFSILEWVKNWLSRVRPQSKWEAHFASLRPGSASGFQRRLLLLQQGPTVYLSGVPSLIDHNDSEVRTYEFDLQSKNVQPICFTYYPLSRGRNNPKYLLSIRKEGYGLTCTITYQNNATEKPTLRLRIKTA